MDTQEDIKNDQKEYMDNIVRESQKILSVQQQEEFFLLKLSCVT